MSGAAAGLTLSLWRDVHAVLDLHVPAEVALQVELTGAVRTLEGFAAGVEMHVAQQVVHSVEGLAAHLEKRNSGLFSRSSFYSAILYSSSSSC